MDNTTLKKGFSLSELLTVISVMALLIGIAVPASKAIMDSVNSSAGLRSMIASSLSAARATAIKEHKYAGVRFQPDSEGNQYMVFIIHDDAPAVVDASERSSYPDKTGLGSNELATPPYYYGLANGFRAVKGHKPIKLPGDGRVMDLKIREAGTYNTGSPDATKPSYIDINTSSRIDGLMEWLDTSTFSIIFSPAGKLVSHEVRVRNRHGLIDGWGYSSDKIFNVKSMVQAGDALLCQDDYAEDPDTTKEFFYDDLGLGQEYSRKSFIIYDKKRFDNYGDDVITRWTHYLSQIEKTYINPYNGQLVGGQLPQ